MAQLWSSGVTFGEEVTVHGRSATELADSYDTPLLVLDEDCFHERARAQASAFARAFAAVSDGAADCDVYYAGKSLLTKAIARWIVNDGLKLDVCTAGEFAVAAAAGVPADRIAFHGNNKSMAELAMAIDAGVGRIVVDSVTEIDRIIELSRSRPGVRVPVLLRITVGVHAGAHEFIQTAHEDQKFGLSVASGAALAAIGRMLNRPDVFDVRGIHSHIGSQIQRVDGFEAAATAVMAFAAAIAETYGHAVREVCLGGGFGIAYTPADEPATIDAFAAAMAHAVATARPASLPWPRFSVEPGRSIVGPAAMTIYRVGTVKEVQLVDRPRVGGPRPGGQRADGQPGEGQALDAGMRRYISVDGGMSDNIRPALYGAQYVAVLASRTSTAPAAPSRVVGKHCESDVLIADASLPADVRDGDLLAVPATGAYTYSLASNYNHQPRPAIVAVGHDGVQVIVRRETAEDLLRLDLG